MRLKDIDIMFESVENDREQCWKWGFLDSPVILHQHVKILNLILTSRVMLIKIEAINYSIVNADTYSKVQPEIDPFKLQYILKSRKKSKSQTFLKLKTR